jgi:aspartyl-tRNA synthetase
MLFFIPEGRDYMAGAVIFDALDDASKTKKLLKDAEQEVRQGMADHLKRYHDQQHGCILSSLTLDPNGHIRNSVVKKCSPEVGRQLAAACAGGAGSAAAVGFLALGPRDFVLPLLGRLRKVLARSLVPDLATRGDSFTWVLDFPLFVIGKE